MTRVMLRILMAIGSVLRTGWLILGITLVLLIVGEVGLRLAFAVKDRLMDRPRTEHPPAALAARSRKDARDLPVPAAGSTDLDPEQASDFVAERRGAYRYIPRPYVHWGHPPLQGRYINVNRDGLRVTWNPPPQEVAGDPPPVRVFTFGSSTMWGHGARDDYTIPSHLSKLLHAQGYRAEVTNYGEAAYVSTQEIITLLRCIQRGEIPDIALFYSGANDVLASYETGEAGLLTGWSWRVDPNLWLRAHGRRLLGNFQGFRRFMTGLRRYIRPPASIGRPQIPPLGDQVARQTLRVYEANLTFIELLGRHYGFEPLFYWQPVLFSKQRRSPREQARVEHRFSRIFEDMYRRVRQSEALNGHARFHNISDLFDDLEEPYYVDGWHLSEAGNRLIAEAMADDVIELIEQLLHRPTTGNSTIPSHPRT